MIKLFRKYDDEIAAQGTSKANDLHSQMERVDKKLAHLNIIIVKQSSSLNDAVTQYRFKCMLIEQLRKRKKLIVERQKSKCVLDHHKFYLPQLQKRLKCLKQQTITMSKSYGRKIRLGIIL